MTDAVRTATERFPGAPAPLMEQDPSPEAALRFFEDPYPTYARWRAAAPIVRLGRNSYFAAGSDAVHEILRDHQRFSSQWPRPNAGPPVRDSGPLLPVLISDDPPKHTRLRHLVNEAFTPRSVAALAPAIREIVEAAVNRFPADGDVEFIGQLAEPLPVTVIARLLGIPEAERERFKRWSGAVIASQRGDAQQQDLTAMQSYLEGEIASRRSQPAEGLLSALTGAELNGERLQDWEVLGFAVILLAAGNESTTSLLGNLLNILADRPALWAALREDRTLVEPVIEEALRFDSPVQILTRWAVGDSVVTGVSLPAEAAISAGFGAANRDPAAFERPDEFRLDRPRDERHVAFGAGIHYCLGAPLARLEATLALEVLLDRYATVGFGSGERIRQRQSTIVRGFSELSLRFG